MLGPVNELTKSFVAIDTTEKSVLIIICVLIIIIGIYPQPLLHISEAAVTNLVDQVNQKILIK